MLRLSLSSSFVYRWLSLLLVALFASSVSHANAQTQARLVRDINTTPVGEQGSQPDNYTAVGSTVYFTAQTDAEGRELWRTNGTEAGTALVRDLVPGKNSSDPSELTAFNNALFFVADDDRGETWVWRTDGTANGTTRVVAPITDYFGGVVGDLTASNNHLFFVVSGRDEDVLWVSDGTTAGSKPLRGFSGETPGENDAAYLTDVNGTLFFRAAFTQLWKTDGTETGTVLVKDLEPNGNAEIAELTAVDSTVFFSADDGASGRELWKSTGTTNSTMRVKDINPGAAGSNPTALTRLGATVYFIADDGTSGRELWQTNGTNSGTIQVADIASGKGSAFGDSPLLAASGNTLYFVANDAVRGNELWKKLGPNVQLVRDIAPGSEGEGPTQLTSANGRFYFVADDGNGTQLYTINTLNGAAEAVEISPKPDAESTPTNLHGIDNRVFFSAGNANSGAEPWLSDGTTAGTRRIRDVARNTSSFPSDLTLFKNRVYFTAQTGNSTGLWSSDGTEAGTTLLAATPQQENTRLYGLRQVGDRLVYLVREGSTKTTLFASDGTTQHTKLIRTFTKPIADQSDYNVVGNRLFFVVNNSSASAELWATDGTDTGTTQLRVFASAITPNQALFQLDQMTVVNNTLYFTVASGNFVHLWRSDGSEQGTQQVGSIQWFGISSLTAFKNELAFVARDTNSIQLWRTDSSTTGVAAFKQFSIGSIVEQLTSVGDRLFFVEHTNRELWTTDGTNSGTVPVKQFENVGTASIFGGVAVLPGELTNVDGTLFFSAIESDYGRELWKSDGTAAGTVRIKDIASGIDSDSPTAITPIGNGKAVFAAAQPDNGMELWQTDGTDAGTTLLAEIAPGPASSNPHKMAQIGGALFFAADDGMHGEELWVIGEIGQLSSSQTNVYLPVVKR